MYRQPIYKYTLANVNLREEKSKDSNVITLIPKGSKIELLDSEEDWLKVLYNGKEGYVYNQYISVSMYPYTNVKLREEKYISSKEITIIPAKARVEVLYEDGDWSKVIYNDEEGYVFSYYLTFDGNKNDRWNYKYFYVDMTEFVNSNKIRSTSTFLLVTNLKERLTYVFIRDNNNTWKQLYKWECTIGKPSTPTITGVFFINGRKPYFGTSQYRVKYATRIKHAYYYHSILYNSTGKYVTDGRLGMALSHGCIRLATENAKWIYENIPDNTTVFIH